MERNKEKSAERWFETAFAYGRWLLAPFFVALIILLIPLFLHAVKECRSVWRSVTQELHWTTGESDPAQIEAEAFQEAVAAVAIQSKVLSLIDTSLVACLLIIVAFSGYQSIVSDFSKSFHEATIKKRMKKIGFTDLKLKLMNSIVAISGVELLKSFLLINPTNKDPAPALPERDLAWKVGIHLTFAISVVLFSIADRVAGKKRSGTGDTSSQEFLQ